MLGRIHLLFVGQVLGSKIYLVRRLSSFTAPPEFIGGQMILRGGLLDDKFVRFEYEFLKSPIDYINDAFDAEVSRLIKASRAAETHI